MIEDLLSLPPQVPDRLAHSHWTVGDGRLLGALCRRRGTPVVLTDKDSLKNGKVSDGGAQLLGALMQMQQVTLISCMCVCWRSCVRSCVCEY